MATLAGCGAGASTSAADCAPTISIEEALAAQNAGMAGVMTGSVEWTNDQASSFLTEILRQNVGPNFPVQQIAICFQPGGQILARVDLGEGVLKGADTLEAVGSITVADQHLSINLAEASASGFMVGEAALAPLNAQLNAALADPAMGTVVDIETGDGTLSISIGGM
jgi:hypothetical protein